jgi:hypothetical protein
MIWADQGSSTPSTLRALTGVDFTSWTQSGSTPNTQYTFQAAATNGILQTTRTAPFSQFTLAAPPRPDLNVACDQTTGSTPSYPTVTFNNPAGFGPGIDGENPHRVTKFLYVWDTKTTHTFTSNELQWNQGALKFEPSTAASYFLHLQSINEMDFTGATYDFGPFNIIPLMGTPTNFTIDAVQTNWIKYSWSDNSAAETGFKMWGDPGPTSPLTLRDTTPANYTAWTWGNLTPNTQYSLQISSCLSACCSSVLTLQ